MKILLSVLAIAVLIFVLYFALSAIVGLLFYIAVALDIAALLVALIRHLFGSRQQKNVFDSKAHSKAEKEAERKLKEMERNVNKQ